MDNQSFPPIQPPFQPDPMPQPIPGQGQGQFPGSDADMSSMPDPMASRTMQSANPMNPNLPPIQQAPPVYQPAPAGMPMVEQVHVELPQKKSIAGLVKTIAIVILSLISVTFIGLFIWMFIEYDAAKSDVEGQIEVAVDAAVDQRTMKLEDEFMQREKYPYRVFSGPADYGQLTFEYPKTWSVYIEKAATTGGDFNAYFNPIQVDAVGKDTINALRVTIRAKLFDEVTAEYQKEMDRKDSNLTVETITINGITANRYTGTIPKTELEGYIVVFKIRDKTAILQTDSYFFTEDFNKLLETVTFNA